MNGKGLCDGVKTDGSLNIPIAGTYIINDSLCYKKF